MPVTRYKIGDFARRISRLGTLSVLVALLGNLLPGAIIEEARHALEHQGYESAIRILQGGGPKSAEEMLLLGRAQFQLGRFEAASETLAKAISADPKNASAANWLGRALGMRAENANPFSAMGLARKARDSFETAVRLDPRSPEAVSDLFSYYLAAPGFLGGGFEKAQTLAESMKNVDAGEYAFLQAQLAEKRNDYQAAERFYLEAQTREPKRVGRWIDLAQFYTRRRMVAKADDALARAKTLTPGAPRLLFDEASLLIRSERNPSAARELLRKYRASARRDADPAPYEVKQLLEKLEKLERK